MTTVWAGQVIQVTIVVSKVSTVLHRDLYSLQWKISLLAAPSTMGTTEHSHRTLEFFKMISAESILLVVDVLKRRLVIGANVTLLSASDTPI